MPRSIMHVCKCVFMLLGLSFICGIGFADTYPSKSIRLIVPFPPGGPTDIVARPLAALLGERLKEQLLLKTKVAPGVQLGRISQPSQRLMVIPCSWER